MLNKINIILDNDLRVAIDSTKKAVSSCFITKYANKEVIY